MAAAVNCNKEQTTWFSNHVISGRIDWTEKLYSHIGRWDSIQYMRSVSHMYGTGYKSYIYRVKADNRTYEVTFRVTGPNSFSFNCEEIDLAAEENEKRAYGRKVAALAKKAGVPWAIASLLKDKDAEGAVEALRAAKTIHNRKLSEEQIHELSCGIARRKAAIASLLEANADAFAIEGQKRSRLFAEYLAG